MDKPYKNLIYFGSLNSYLQFMEEHDSFLKKRGLQVPHLDSLDLISRNTVDTVFIYEEWLHLQEDTREFFLSDEFKKQNNTYLNCGFFNGGKKILFPRNKGGDEDEKVNRFGIMEF